MSKRAYDEDVQHVPVPAAAARWWIRRFQKAGKPRGALMVFGSDSVRYLDLDATMAELQDAVGPAPGRYRVDAVEDDVVEDSDAHEKSGA
jgi:hypothetical protein